jgi:ribosomal protein L37AE/L43A
MFTINKYGLWYNKHLLSVMFVTRREKKGNRSDVKEYVYTVKRGLTIEPEDLKLSRKVFNHILLKQRKPSFQHINMNLDNKVAVITEKMTDKAKTFDYWLRLVEKLDFRNLNLSKRINRLLSRFGKACVVTKLKSMEEEFGIVTMYENSAYTSQQCSVCGYMDKSNRKSQSVFECKFCHSIIHADVNAPRNLMKRSSLPAPFSLYMSHANILRALTKSFLNSLSSTERKHHLRHSDAVSLLSANPYFAGDLAQLKGQ